MAASLLHGVHATSTAEQLLSLGDLVRLAEGQAAGAPAMMCWTSWISAMSKSLPHCHCHTYKTSLRLIRRLGEGRERNRLQAALEDVQISPRLSSKERKRKRKGKGRDRTGAGEERKKDGKTEHKKRTGQERSGRDRSRKERKRRRKRQQQEQEREHERKWKGGEGNERKETK